MVTDSNSCPSIVNYWCLCLLCEKQFNSCVFTNETTQTSYVEEIGFINEFKDWTLHGIYRVLFSLIIFMIHK